MAKRVAWSVVALLLMLAAVSLWKGDEPGSRINPLRGTELRLPRIGTVGQEPPADMRILISVTRAGYVRVGTDPKHLSLHELRDTLTRLASVPDLREPDGASRLAVLLDIDETTPWVAVQWLMQTCAHPAIKIYRLSFGARATMDDAEGALATLLPRDNGGPGHGFGDPPPRIKVKAFHREHAPSDPRALYAALLEVPEAKRREARWEFVTPPPHGGSVPYGNVLAVLDVMLAAGATDVMFEGAALPATDEIFGDAETFAAYLAAKKASPGALVLMLDNRMIAADAPTAEVPREGRVERVVGAPREDEWEDEILEPEIWLEEPVIKDDESSPPDLSGLKTPGEEEPIVKIEPIQNGINLPLEQPHRARPLDGPRGPSLFPLRGGARPKTHAELQRLGAVQHALAWLAAHQREDGGWSAAGERAGHAAFDPGVTGLALCAFLSAGYTNRGRHPYAKAVSKGLRHLKNIQDPEGCFGPRTHQRYGYNHAAAALAMLEIYGMTGSPIFKGSAQRALEFIDRSRNPDLAWHYGVKPGDNDTSISAWMLMPVVSAKMTNDDAFKRGKPEPLKIDPKSFDGVTAWLDRMTDKATGKIGYDERGQGPARDQELQDSFPPERSEGTTAAGAVCRILGGIDPRKDPVLKRSLARLSALPPTWKPETGDIDMAYWYWGTLAAWQAGGTLWNTWLPALDNAVVATQHAEGEHAGLRGSWDPIGAWGAQGGRVYATAVLCLCCQVADRHARRHK